MRPPYWICSLIVLLLTIPVIVEAGEVVLKNGDKISGRIVKMENKKLEVAPDYISGTISIDWKDVVSVTTERPMSIKLYGEVNIPEGVGELRGDRIILQHLSVGGPIRLEDVRTINLAREDYHGYASVGGNKLSGNSDTAALNISGTLTFRAEEHRFILEGKYNWASAEGATVANNGAFTVYYDYFLRRRFSAIGMNLVESDEFQSLAVRNTGGLLLGYDLVDSSQHMLTVGAGPAGVYQDFTTTASTLTPSAAWLVRYEFRFRGDDVIVFHKQQGFQDIGHGSALRLNADQGIRVKITGDWRLNVEFDVRYNSGLPDMGRKAVDTSIIFGISYHLKP